MAASHAPRATREERREFIGLDATARQTLRDLKPSFARHPGASTDAFYEKVRSNRHTAEAARQACRSVGATALLASPGTSGREEFQRREAWGTPVREA